MNIKLPILLAFAALFVGFSLLAQNAGTSTEWVAPSRAAKKPNPVPVSLASLAKGKALYTAECAACHGDSGRGDGPKAGSLEQKPRDLASPEITSQSDGAIFWKLAEGKAPMPNYAKLSEEERWNIINYMRSLK